MKTRLKDLYATIWRKCIHGCNHHYKNVLPKKLLNSLEYACREQGIPCRFSTCHNNEFRKWDANYENAVTKRSVSYSVKSCKTFNTFLMPVRHGHYCPSLASAYPWHHASCLLSTQRHRHLADRVQFFKSSAKDAPPPGTTDNSSSSPSTSSDPPKPQSIKRLLNLAAPELWTLAGGIALLSVSSAVTMSVPFVIGTLIDTIYSNGGTSSGGFFSAVESFSSASSPSVLVGVLNDTQVPELIAHSTNVLSVGEAPLQSSTVQDAVQRPPSTNLEQVCAMLAGIFLVGGAANFGRVYLMTTAGQRISQTLRSKVFSSLLRQETAFFDRHRTGELLSRLAADTPLVAQAVTTNVADGVRSTLMTVAAVSMMVYTSAELSLFGLSVVPPVALLGAYYGRRLRTTAASVQEKLAGCTQHAEERLGNVRTVRLFAQETREMAAQDQHLQQALSVMYREAKMRSVFFGLTGLTGNMIVLSVLYKGSSLVSSGLLSVGSLSAFLMYAAYVGISVSGLTSAYTELSKGAGAADRLFELMDREPLMPLHGGDQVMMSSLSGSVEFRDVHFSYPTRPHAKIFDGLNLSVQAGRVVSVVGPSGCGKSTVLALLLRLYDPTAGSIFIDGRDIRSLDPTSLRAAIGVVNQEPVLFSGTIRENLLYGSPEPAAVTEQQLEEAAQQANALEFVAKFSKGFDTVVGERGVLLSGGQRQRLAIARAIVTAPRILCLDEATSALDSESEHLVQEAIERVMRDRTVITIAHRLSTIRTADDIAVLQHGRVAELGSFSSLMSRPDGVFRKLVNRQTSGDLSDITDR